MEDAKPPGHETGSPGHAAGLPGRRAECGRLDRLLADVRSGRSQALVVRGEAGAGKSALLGHLIAQARDCRVVCAAGVRSESQVPYAALHALCAPMLDLLDTLPGPQRDALDTAFGLREGPPPDRLLLGLAVLGVLAAATADRPLVCVIDDAQYLDPASAQVLAFAARRLCTGSVACVFALRDADRTSELSGLPTMDVAGLFPDDARALLRSAVHGPLDEQVGERLVAEARGNPRALLELVREYTRPELAGGFGTPAASTLPGHLEDGFLRRLGHMPAPTRRLLLLAAADPLGDPALLWRAAVRLGLGVSSLGAANDLIVIDVRVRFRHPLMRSAVYRAALPEERRRVHLALAEATDATAAPDRRAWHRAHATARPDEEVAAELERTATRARSRGGLAAVAAFLERAAALTPGPRRRAERALAAATAKHLAGAPAAALTLLATAEGGPLDERRLAHAQLLRAVITNPGHSAVPLLLSVAQRVEPLDTALARDTHLQALSAALGAEGPVLREIASAARTAPPPPATPGTADLLLDALTAHLTQAHATAAPPMRRALTAFLRADVPDAERLRWSRPAHTIAMALWDDTSSRELADRHVRVIRETGALALLPLALSTRLMLLAFEGRLDEAASVDEEIRTLAAGTRSGSPGLAAGDALVLAAWQGRRNELMSEGSGLSVAVTQWLRAVLHNGLGRHEEAKVAAERACAHHPSPGAAAQWAPVELIEAAVRSGDRELAARTLDRLVPATRASGTDWALGIEARSRALLAQGDEADGLYQEAIRRLGRTRMRADLARAHLLHGEWLRAEGRQGEALERLRTAFELFTAMGMAGFAGRTKRELPTAGGGDRLTSHEGQIVRLVRQGLTNKEIAGHLHVSHKTVEYHLGKVYAKLGIASRRELGRVS
ncbi:AAA family ATPase [Nonomuraea sp. PA05]|nr:AAA family ATPase [Nonomuraea sp. PA05]